MTDLKLLVQHAAERGWVHFPEQKPDPARPIVVGKAWSNHHEYMREYMRSWYALRYAQGLTSRGTPRKRSYHRNTTPEEKHARDLEWRRRFRSKRIAAGLTVHGKPRKRPYLPRSKNHDSA